MTDFPTIAAQHAQRITSLEDLLRRNESSLGTLLNRVKDSETALNNFHRILSKMGPDLAGNMEEMTAFKRKLDLVDQSWQSKARELDSIVVNEVRGGKPPPITADPMFQRMAQEVQHVRQELSDTIMQVRKLSDVAFNDGKVSRQTEQDAKWLTEQVRDQVANFRDFANQQNRRNEQAQQQMVELKQELEHTQTGFKQIIDTVVKATREEMVLRVESEAKARTALQSDFLTAFTKMREDVVKGFAETATNLRHLDETNHSLETVLRAEVRSRIATIEEHTRRVEVVEERLRREALSAAEYLKALDTQMSAALRDVRDVTASECRAQLETLWRSFGDVSENVKRLMAESHAQNSSEYERVKEERHAMAIQTEVQKAKEEILGRCEDRIASATTKISEFVTRSELNEVNTRLSYKIQDLERAKFKGVLVEGGSGQTAGGGHGQVNAATTAAIKKIASRVEDTEKQVVVVAEAIKDVHDDLIEKLEKIETQAASVDALTRALQDAFSQDQDRMQKQVQVMREQIIAVSEKTDGGTPSDDGTEKPSGAIAASHKMLDIEISTLREQYNSFSLGARSALAELKTGQDQLYERHLGIQKSTKDELASLRTDLTSLSTRMGENDEQLAEKIHRTTTATNNNFQAVDEELQWIKEQLSAGKAAPSRASTVGSQAAPSAQISRPATGAEVKQDTVEKLSTRVTKIEDTIKAMDSRLDDFEEGQRRLPEQVKEIVEQIRAEHMAEAEAEEEPDAAGS